MTEKLLYDIVQLLEWPPEEEKVQETNKETSLLKASYELVSLSSKKALSYLPTVSIPYKKANQLQILDALTSLTQRQKWRFSVSPDHKYVIIFQKRLLEVRYLDEELTVTGKYSPIPADFSTNLVVAWDEESAMFAASLFYGRVHLFDTTCTLLSTIKLTPDSETEEQTSNYVACSMMFIKSRSKTQTNQCELLILTKSGTLASYFVNSKECELSHTFNFGIAYSHGISCAFMDDANRLLVIGGSTNCEVDCDQEVTGSQFGITKWRVLSDFPYYTKDLSESMNSSERFKKGILTRAFTYSRDALQRLYTNPMNGIYAMAPSPDQSKVIAIHHNGDLSYWDFPSLRMKSKWSLQEQPHHSDVNPSLTSRFGRKRRHDDSGPISFYPFDVSWWDSESVVVSRCSGCLTILSVSQPELVNLFGDQCEWITPFCQISSTVNERFYMLECNTETVSNKKKMKTDSSVDNHGDDDDDDESSLMQRGIHFAKYYTGMASPKTKERHYSHKYSLATLTKTTPQELYQRKIDDQEFGEALSIAQVYNLDCDKVFQRQWRSSPVSKATIQDYLSKIGNCHWVFRECLDRVPERMDDVKELLDFALQITDIDKMALLAKSDLVLTDDEDEAIDDYDGFDYEVQKQRETEKRQKFENKWMAHVDLKNLSLEQREMLACRQKILNFKDRLSTYILLQGGYDAANERYTANDFATFRKRDLFDLALEYVRSSRWEHLDTLMQYHTNQLRPHWLPLLSNFSETLLPRTYECLLPEVKRGEVLPLLRQQHRPCPDWSETMIKNTPQCDVEEFYENNSFLTKFSVCDVSPQLASEWYQQRASQMEKLTQQTEEALQLIEIGVAKGISGLSQLQFDLTALDNLVFECGCELALSLDDLVQKSPLERIRLMMAQSVPPTFVRDIQQLVLPFVKFSDQEKLLETYLVETAEQNLVLPFLVFKYMFTHKPIDCNFHTNKDVIDAAVDCVFAMEVPGQLDIAYRIIACLPKCDGPDKKEMKEKIEALERNLDACGIFAKHKVPMTPSKLREIAMDRSQALLLFKRLTRTLALQDIISASQVNNVLDDMLSISSGMFSSMIDQTTCIHVLIESLLTSGITENIRLAGNVMARSADETRPTNRKFQLPYKDSVDLVLRSAREYFDAASIPLQNNKLLQTSRLCLQLITDRPPEIQEQLNLIEAVSLLSAFGLEMLPLEVRLCKDRLEIVQKILDLSPTNYMKEEPILRLSSLMNISGDDKEERIGRTKCAIVKQALKSNDLKVAIRLINDLVSMNYSHAWRLCAELGTCEEVQDLQFRCSCISFASCYCDEEKLATMTDELCKITALLLEQSLEEQTVQSEEPPQDTEISEDDRVKIPDLPVSRTLKASADLLAGTVTATTGVFLSGLSLLKKEPRSSISSPSPADIDPLEHGDDSFETQMCPAFYKSILAGADDVMYNIGGYSSINEVSLLQHQTMLRINQLARVDDQVLDNLKTLASISLTKDLPLGLSYLLAVSDANDVEECFQTLPFTSLSLQLRAYYHCLKHFSDAFSVATECLLIYRIPPSVFLDYAITHFGIRRSNVSISPLQQAVGSLVDFIQGEKLCELGQDVDIARCMTDSSYMDDITHGLALTTNEDQFLIAILLADQGQCDVWEVLAAHVEFLFTETGSIIKQDEFFGKLNRLKILSPLLSREQDLFKRLDAKVFPLIDGRDHSTLLCYFNLLNECDWNELHELESVNDICKMSPQTHVKCLKKISNCALDMDYKKLIQRNASLEILELLKNGLNGNNVAMLTKLIPKIPYENHSITSSSVILCWVEKRFWRDDRGQASGENSMQKLEQLTKWLTQLDAVDLESFIEGLLFSQESLTTFTYELRFQFLKFGLKFIKTKIETNKVSELQGFTSLKKKLEKLTSHFSVFSTKFMKEVIDLAATDPKKREFLAAYDLSRSEPDKLLIIAVQSMLESAMLTKRFLAVLPDVKWTMEFILKTCITQLTNQLSEASDDSAIKSALSSLENLLSSIEECKGKEKSKLLDLVVSIVQDFCNDKSIDIKLKIDVLQLLRKSASLSPGQVDFLLFHRTSELIRAGWGEGVADEIFKDTSSISSDSTHIHIVDFLLQDSCSLQQINNLSKIVEILRQGSSSVTPTSDELWLKVILAYTQHGAVGGEEIISKTKQLNVSEKIALPVFEKLLSNSMVLAAAKLALIADLSAVDEKLGRLLQEVDEVNDTNCDDEMLKLLIDSGKALLALSTLYYHRVVEYLTSESCENAKEKVDRLVRRLQDNGHISEAATLLLRYRGSHTAFATFGSSISLISDWLTKF